MEAQPIPRDQWTATFESFRATTDAWTSYLTHSVRPHEFSHRLGSLDGISPEKRPSRHLEGACKAPKWNSLRFQR
jgi:hypothetical protein